MDVFCIGEIVIDFLPGQEPESYVRNLGGAPANVSIAVARNGLKSGLCAKVGDDDFGRFLTKTLEDNHVRMLGGLPTGQAVTTMAFVTLYPGGERSFTFARKPGADMLLSRKDVREEDINSSLIVHSGSCSLSKGPAADATRYSLERGHELGKMVSFDINYRALLWDEDKAEATQQVREILPQVDFLKVSEEELDMLGGEGKIPQVMAENDITLTALTLGPKGAKCYWQGRELFAEGLTVECVDTTGAGDAFWGAFLSTLILRGIRAPQEITEAILRDAMRDGNIAGALCVQKKGAIHSLPTRAEIAAFIDREV